MSIEEDIEYLINYKTNTLYIKDIPNKEGKYITSVNIIDITERIKLAIKGFFSNVKEDIVTYEIFRWDEKNRQNAKKISLSKFGLEKIKEFNEILSLINIDSATSQKISLNNFDVNELNHILTIFDKSDIIKEIEKSGISSNDIKFITQKKKDIEDFENRLSNTSNFQESSKDDNWQDWFSDRKWIFGSEYVEILKKRTIDEDNISDYLVQTNCGFIEIIEIKDPNECKKKFLIEKTKEKEGNTTGYFYPSSDLSQAIMQTLNYINKVEKRINDAEFIKSLGNSLVLKPRGTLVYGRSNNFSDLENESLRIINSHYNNFQIITYDQLLNRAKNILKYDEKD